MLLSCVIQKVARGTEVNGTDRAAKHFVLPMGLKVMVGPERSAWKRYSAALAVIVGADVWLKIMKYVCSVQQSAERVLLLTSNLLPLFSASNVDHRLQTYIACEGTSLFNFNRSRWDAENATVGSRCSRSKGALRSN